MITSTRNPRIAAVRRLARARERRATGRTTIEGPFLLEEAIANAVEIVEVFALPDDTVTQQRCAQGGIPLSLVTQDVLEALAGSVTPRGPVAVITVPETARLLAADSIVLWDIADPGNAGTIIRTAAAFGFQVVATDGTVDLWSPKVIRAGVGGHFRSALVTGCAPEPSVLVKAGLLPVVADAEHGALEALESADPIALIVGNEAHGVPSPILESPGVATVSLPMPGGAESLNAAVAAGILMYLRMTRR